jgi:hypothetical protein
MRQSYGNMGAQILSSAALFTKPYFIVERDFPVAGTGETYTLYMKLPGEWSEEKTDAMRFPQRTLAESYAARFKGVVAERKP